MSETDRLSDNADENRATLSADSSAVGVGVVKTCCMCGSDLHGRTRYKDSTGRYWCPTCNEKDRLSKEPAVCPDCNQDFTKADLVDFKGTAVCQTCWEKRRASAHREEARLRAIEEEVRADEERARRWKLIFSAILAVLVVWGIVYGVYWFMGRGS